MPSETATKKAANDTANDMKVSPDWGPCCVCKSTSEEVADDPNRARAVHENNHRGCDVCSACVNLDHSGQLIKGR